MFLTLIERSQLLEWYDDFLKLRIKIQKNKKLPDLEIIKIYKEAIKWCEKTRLELSQKIIGG